MTPRALLTAIGATATAFAIVIGVAAGGATGSFSEERAGVVAVVADRQHAPSFSSSETPAVPAVGDRLAARNDPCVIVM